MSKKENDEVMSKKEKDGDMSKKEKDGDMSKKEKDGDMSKKDKDGDMSKKEKDEAMSKNKGDSSKTPSTQGTQRKGKNLNYEERGSISREIERLHKLSREQLKHLPEYLRKKFTPYIHNDLEPYINPKQLTSLEPRKVQSTALSRQTAISTQEAWRDLLLEKPLQFPRINKKALVQLKPSATQMKLKTQRMQEQEREIERRLTTLQDIKARIKTLEEYAQSERPDPKIHLSKDEKTAHEANSSLGEEKATSEGKGPKIKLSLLEKLEEQLRIECDGKEPKDKSPDPPKEKGKSVKKSKSASRARDKLRGRRQKMKGRRPHGQSSRSVSTASEGVRRDPKPPSTPPPTYPRVSMPLQPPASARSAQLNHDDVPMIRELVNKKHMKVNHLDKELSDYLRTKHHYERLSKQLPATSRSKARQKMRLNETYCAYLATTPGSSRAIRECLMGGKEAKAMRRLSGGGIGCF